MSKIQDTLSIIQRIRKETDTAVLYYSAGGKDGIMLLDLLAKAFPRVICYYMYLVKGLRHVEPYIRWAETRYRGISNVEVRQIEHFSLSAIRKHGVFCPKVPGTKIVKIGEIEEMVRQETGQHYAFSGMKGVDGYMKRMRLKMFAKTGYVTEKGMVYPIALWTNKEVLAYIELNKLIKPFVYEEGAVSQGCAIDLATMEKLKRGYPEDYDMMLAAFPYWRKVEYDLANNKQSTAII